VRYDAPAPAEIVLDLLSRADQLAVALSDAILGGDDARMAALLDDREAVVAAVIRACADTVATRPTAGQLSQLAHAGHETVAAGHVAQAAATRTRDLIVAELAALDARQQASDDYQADMPHGSIDVVL
jgi:hypothetical protein